MGKFAMELKIARLFKKFKTSKLHIDKNIYKAVRYILHKMIINNKKTVFFENKVTESIGKPKYLRKAFRSLGLPSKLPLAKL